MQAEGEVNKKGEEAQHKFCAEASEQRRRRDNITAQSHNANTMERRA